MEGSKLDSGGTGVVAVWKNTIKLPPGINKETGNAELWSIPDVLGIALRETTPRRAHKIAGFSNS